MARTRSIKPDFWNHPLVIECSPEARLLFIGLWSHSDDGGRHPATPKAIKGKVFPADPFTAEQVEGWLKELVANGLLKAYAANGLTLLEVADWSKWHSVKNPSFQWPDETGEIPGRKRKGRDPIRAAEPEPQPDPPVDTPSSSPEKAKPRRRQPASPKSALPDALAQHEEQINAYANGTWKLEWGNAPGKAGCALPTDVQAHIMGKYGEMELVVE